MQTLRRMRNSGAKFLMYSLKLLMNSIALFAAVAGVFWAAALVYYLFTLFSSNPMPAGFGVYFAVMTVVCVALVWGGLQYRRSP